MLTYELIIENEKTIRLGVFIGILSIIALWEILAPRRDLRISKALRWSNNLGLVFFNSLISRLVYPVAALGVATFAEEHGWGLFNFYSLGFLASMILSIIALDFVIYLQHIMFHAVPLLWRLHRVHHADLDYDVTTGVRFHTLEILLSMLIKFAAIVILGPPIVAVILFEVVLNTMAMFNHGNIKLPIGMDKLLRWFVVTPDMHRVHHSIEDDEANSNFGFNLSMWDRLFGTYREQPRLNHQEMKIGIRKFQTLKQTAWISAILVMPFVGKNSGYTINRRQWINADED